MFPRLMVCHNHVFNLGNNKHVDHFIAVIMYFKIFKSLIKALQFTKKMIRPYGCGNSIQMKEIIFITSLQKRSLFRMDTIPICSTDAVLYFHY